MLNERFMSPVAKIRTLERRRFVVSAMAGKS
jgi:hypothetical protein